jgi:hypothetical protein
MDSTSSYLGVRTARAAAGVSLAAFVAFLASPDVARPAVMLVLTASCVAVVVSAVAWMRTPIGSVPIGVTAAVSAAGLVGSVAYLSSIADEPAAIPLGGTAVLLASLVGLVVSLFTLHDW